MLAVAVAALLLCGTAASAAAVRISLTVKFEDSGTVDSIARVVGGAQLKSSLPEPLRADLQQLVRGGGSRVGPRWPTRATGRAGTGDRAFRLHWQAPERIDRLVLRVRLISRGRVVATSAPRTAIRRESAHLPAAVPQPLASPHLPLTPEIPPPEEPPPPADTGTVLPGTEAVIAVGGVILAVPAGTVEQPATASVKPLPEGDPDLGGFGADLHIDADWQNGTKSVRITMPLAEMEPGMEPMVVHDLPDGRRELLMGDRLDVDQVTKTVSFDATSLSRFWSVTMPSAFRLVSGGPAIYDYDLAQRLFEEFVGLSADQPVCNPDLTESEYVSSAGSAFTSPGVLLGRPAIRHCVSMRPAAGSQPDRGRWVLANNTGAVLRVSVSGAAEVVNFGVSKDLLTDVAFLALNGASSDTIDAGTPSATDSAYGPEVFIPPGGSAVVTVPVGERGQVHFAASPELLPHAFVLRQLGTLLGSRSEAVELLDRLNNCGYSLAVSQLNGLVSCIREVATEMGGQAGKLLKKALLAVDAFASSVSTFVHTVNPLDAELRYSAAGSPLGDPRIERVDVAVDGGPSDAFVVPWSVDISRNGCRIAFISDATNLVPGPDPPGSLGDDVYVRDICAHTTTKVTVPIRSAMGCWGEINALRISGNGRFVVFGSCAKNLAPADDAWSYLYVHDLLSGQTRTIPGAPADNVFRGLEISDDGRWITFVDFDSLNDSAAQVALFDRVTRTSQTISRSPTGETAKRHAVPDSISGDGRFIAYNSTLDTFSQSPSSSPYSEPDTVYVYDRALGTTRTIPRFDECQYPVYDDETDYFPVDNARLTESGTKLLLTCKVAIGLFDMTDGNWQLIDKNTETTESSTTGRCVLSPEQSWVAADITPDARFVAYGRACLPPGEDSYRQFSRVVIRDLDSGEEDSIGPPPGSEGATTIGYLPGTLSADAKVVVYIGLGGEWPLMAAVH